MTAPAATTNLVASTPPDPVHRPGFPRDLLAAAPAERLAYFQGYTVAHPQLKAVDAALAAALDEPAGAGLVLVYGPTGAGKTTLLRHTVRRVTEATLPLLAADPGRLPIVGLEAVSPDARAFDWKDYYLRALIAVAEPLATEKRARTAPGHASAASPVLRRAWEQALRHRRPRAVLIDEAQHLAKAGSARKLADQLDCLKSHANLTGTVHVLFGTYDLLAFRNLSGQLSRRSVDLHLPRYRLEEAGDAESFQLVLRAFQRHLPLAEEPDLLGRWDYCYERSLGCVGTLKDWLTRAYAAALRAGTPTLTRAQLDAAAHTAPQCLTMLAEARAGEAALAEEARAGEQLQALLGGGAAPRPRPPGATSPPPARRAGRRAPGRDPVGPDTQRGQAGHAR